jgi:hypothetical protein
MPIYFFVFGLITSLAAMKASPAQPHDYIRVVQDNGVWWFQDGSGRKFFSVGVNCVGGCYGHAEDAPMTPSRKQWIVSLLKDWRFNTAGCWSSPSVWDSLYLADQLYPEFVEHRHDVFDEAWWTISFAERLRQEVQPFLGRQNVLGYFLDNEPEWNAERVFEFYVGLPKETPGSRAFVAFLRQYYQGHVRQLNREWRTSYRSVEDIPGTPPPKPYALALRRGLLNAWRTEVAATYYRRYAALVRALDPHHLILGIRYKGIPDLPLFTALSSYFDVNSINDYNRYGHVRPIYAELYNATGRPLMITEFSFSGFPHPGQPSGLFVDVYTQENRGIGYQKFVWQAAQAPFMVGLHWFMWSDYAESVGTEAGYPYPPDRNVGLVSNDERTVYEELARWVKRTNAEVETVHQEARWVPPPAPELPHIMVRRFVPVVDGDLSEWPKAPAITPHIGHALRDHVPMDHTYFLTWDRHNIYLGADISDSNLDYPGQDWAWEGDSWSIHFSPVQTPDARLEAAPAIVIYPWGGGANGQQPYASWREDSGGEQRLPIRVERRLRPGGYTLEARLPSTAIRGGPWEAGGSWLVRLTYQNVNELYQTQWEGVVLLQPAAESPR